MPPQFCTLRELSKISFEELQNQVSDPNYSRSVRPTIPEIVHTSPDMTVMAIPGDSRHSDPAKFGVNELILSLESKRVVKIEWNQTKSHL